MYSGDLYLLYCARRLSGLGELSEKRYAESRKIFEKILEDDFVTQEDSAYYYWSLVGEGDYDKAFWENNEETINSESITPYVRYNILKGMGDYKNALTELEKHDSVSNVLLRKRIESNLNSEVIAYHDYQEQIARREAEKAQAYLWFISIGSLIVIILGIVYLHYRKKNHVLLLNEKLALAEHLQKELNDIKHADSDKANIIKELLDGRYGFLDELCEITCEYKDTAVYHKKIALRIDCIIKSMTIENDEIEKLEKYVNNSYDNLYTDFRNDLPGLREKDYKLFLFSILKFSNTTIALFP